MNDPALLVDLHIGGERQGPGSAAQTRRAIALAELSGRAALKVADIGCGTGASALLLAAQLDAQVLAIDRVPELLAALAGRASRAGLAGRIQPVQATMDHLPIAPGSLDVLWSEGATYNMGFENGVRHWHRLLKPGGVLAVSKLTWLTWQQPAELQAHCLAQYAEVDTASAKLAVLERNGHTPLGHFVLPPSCWLRHNRHPMQQRFAAFLDRQGHSAAVRAQVAAEQAEMDLHARYTACFGYGFYVARKTDDPDWAPVGSRPGRGAVDHGPVRRPAADAKPLGLTPEAGRFAVSLGTMRVASIIDRVAGLGSDKWRIHFKARQMAARGEAVIQLTIGEPDQPTPTALIEAAHRALQAGRTGYSNGRGEPAVLRALAAKYSARTGRSVGTDQFIWVPGTQSALYLLLMGLVETGDEVLVADPCYATYHGLVRATGAVTVPVALRPERGFRLDADDLARAVTPATRLVFLNSPHNPTGAVLTRDDMRAIGAVARAHDLWILSDEVYESLVYDGPFASPFDEADLADRTVVASSLSKSHAAPGFRAGWAAGPAGFIARLLPLAESMLFGAQPFIADMAAEALSRDFAITGQMRDAYARRAAMVGELLAGVPGLRVHPPQAGMFVMLSVQGLGLSGEAFAERLLDDAQVAVMPGIAFGAAAAGMVRLSVTVPDAVLAEGCSRLAALARRMAPG